jgi:predicted nucleic acid-binding protein
MEWIAQVRGKLVGLDTAPIIYYIERHPLYIETLRSFFQAVNKGECALVTSVMSLLEVLVIPIRLGNTDLARQYQDILFKTKGLTTMSISPNIAEEAAKLRASYNIRTPDAIQMAIATFARAEFFLTNDKHLPSLPGLQVLVLDNLKEDS